MKVAQIIPCLGCNSGGPSRSVYELTKGLRTIGVEAEVLTNNYLENPNIACDEWIQKVDVKKISPFEYNNKFKGLLKRTRYDLFHVHSIYSYPVTIAAEYARKNNIPYIVAPRGSFYEAAIESSSKIKKMIFNKLLLIPELNHASAVHATCLEEMEQIRKLGVKTPIAVIPNSISIPEKKPVISMPPSFKLCYLGRINPIKNIDSLLKGWSLSGMANRNDAELVIIGDAKLEKEKTYLIELHQLERDLKICNISWKGNLIGPEKDAVLNSCSYLILPSFSENFGMVVVEALIQGVPVVASKGTPWSMLKEVGCGWWINNNPEDIAKQIKGLLDISNNERMKMGVKGQSFVEAYFSTNAVSNSLLKLYDWIINGGENPPFVYL